MTDSVGNNDVVCDLLGSWNPGRHAEASHTFSIEPIGWPIISRMTSMGELQPLGLVHSEIGDTFKVFLVVGQHHQIMV